MGREDTEGESEGILEGGALDVGRDEVLGEKVSPVDGIWELVGREDTEGEPEGMPEGGTLDVGREEVVSEGTKLGPEDGI